MGRAGGGRRGARGEAAGQDNAIRAQAVAGDGSRVGDCSKTVEVVVAGGDKVEGAPHGLLWPTITSG